MKGYIIDNEKFTIDCKHGRAPMLVNERLLCTICGEDEQITNQDNPDKEIKIKE